MENGHQITLALPKMTPAEFDRFRDLIYAQTHIFCVEAQKPLFERKIRIRMTTLQVSSYQDYYALLTDTTKGTAELGHLIDLVAVHETSFFRISGQFSGLETIVFPQLLKRKDQKELTPVAGKMSALQSNRDIRIWSAGCSTGEEPYSIAISFLETLVREGLDISTTRGVKIFATDISPTIIAKAQQGIYAPKEVRKIPKPLLDKYFDYRDHYYYLRQQVTQLVTFHVFNLIYLETPPARDYDVVFCRNLLIYFDRPAQLRLMTGLVNLLSAGGYLFLGDTESLHLFPDSAKHFEFVESGNATIYRKRGG